MADTDTMKFGPQWLRQLSDGGGNVYSPPPTPVANLGPFGKFKLADYRYGKEEILALYQPRKDPPECLKRFTEILCEDGPQNPVSVGPLSEDEQRLLMHGVNSNQVYRMMSSSHRVANNQGESGSVDVGVGRGGGVGGGGSNNSGSSGPVGASGRGGRGRGARRVGESVGEVGGETVESGFNRGPPAPGNRNRATRGGGGGGTGENSNPGRGAFRGRADVTQGADEVGDSNGDWRRVSRQRFPSESDTDWRRGPRTGSTKDSLQSQQQRGVNTGGSGGGRVGGGGNRGSSGSSKANDSSGSWRQRPNSSSSEQRHTGALAGSGGGRGRGVAREKGSLQRPDSEEEIPEWVNDENDGKEDQSTGFFDSSGAYKPTGRGSRSYRARQTSSGSSGGGSGPRNNDSEEYWEDDWETEFELYDGLDGSGGRQELHKERHSSSNDDGDEEINEKMSPSTPETRSDKEASCETSTVQKPSVTKEAAVRPSVLSNTASLHPAGLEQASCSEPNQPSGVTPLAFSDPSIKAIIPNPGMTVETTMATSLQPANQRWFYRDPQGRNQGPFSAAQMLEWYHAGFFDPSLAIRRACDTNFSSLESYFKAFGGQTFVGALPANALSPVSPDPGQLHLLLQQRQLALLIKQQQQQQQPQPQSPEKVAAGLVSPTPDMIMLNLLLLQQQLLASGMAVPDNLVEQIENLKRQNPSLQASAADGTHFPPNVSQTCASPIDATPALLQSTPATQWASVPSIPSTGVSGSSEVALWQKKILEQQLAHQAAMRAEREEMERDRAELARQRQQQEAAKKAVLEAEEAELERRRLEVEERERRLQEEEMERRQLARRQEEERQELERRRLEMEEMEKQRLAEAMRLAQQQKEAEDHLRKMREVEERRQSELRRLQEEEEAEQARRKIDQERAEMDRRRAEQERAEMERRRAEQERAEMERRRAEQERAEMERRRGEQERVEMERRRAEQERVEMERRRAEQERMELERRRTEQERAEMERRRAEEDMLAFERRRKQEEEARRSQLNKFQLPDSARWASDGLVSPGTASGPSQPLNLLEIQRLQQKKEEEEAQEQRAMRLEREAAKLSAQRQAQLGPWNVGSGPGVPSLPSAVVSARQKSFMEIQAEEQAREEAGVRPGPTLKVTTAAPTSGASIWGTNWSSKVQQPPSPSAHASQRTLQTALASKSAAQQQQQQQIQHQQQQQQIQHQQQQQQQIQPQQQAKGRSVWNYGGATAKSAAEPQSKAFPTLSSGATTEGSQRAKQQQPTVTAAISKKKGPASKAEERVSKLFGSGERNTDDELTRWCKVALDRVACPTTLDKAMFVEYLISMETAADIEEMMGAYHYDPGQTKKFVAEFLEKRRQFRKAVAEGTEIVLPFTDNFSKTKEDEFQKVGSSNKAGGNKRNRKKKAQKVSNLLSIRATADPDRVNVGQIEFAD